MSSPFDNVFLRLFEEGYPQRIARQLNQFACCELGYRLAGTEADNQAAAYLVRELQALGGADVRLEPVPVDVWQVNGARLEVDGKSHTCSQFPGVRGTGPQGITGPLVYAGEGTAQDFAKLEDQGRNVQGAIVLVDLALESWWLNLPAAEATTRKAAGVVFTYGANSHPWYSPDTCLGTNDGQYDDSFVPAVYLSRADGRRLKRRLARQTGPPVMATLVSQIDITPAAEGGTGYNVIGRLRGRSDSKAALMLAAHHDAHFRAGLDDTAAVANLLAIARAITESAQALDRDLVFLITTAEEFGQSSSWYDWCIGAWWAVTRTHPEWAGELAAVLNLELMTQHGARVEIGPSPELSSWVQEHAEEAEKDGLLPFGFTVEERINTWQDGWVFTASGVPSISFFAGGDGYAEIYHTTEETLTLVDWEHLAGIGRFVFRLLQDLDGSRPPFRLIEWSTSFESQLFPEQLRSVGADPRVVEDLAEAVRSFREAAAAWEAGGRPEKPALEALRFLGNALVGLDAWDFTAFPHTQIQHDLEGLVDCLQALSRTPALRNEALSALRRTGLTRVGLNFSPSVFRHDLNRRSPDYPRLAWAALGHPCLPLDVLDPYAWIEEGRYETAATALRILLDERIGMLNKRLEEEALAFRSAQACLAPPAASGQAAEPSST